MTSARLGVRLAVVALLVAAPVVLDNYRTFLLTEILIFGLLAASLDLLLGYSGLASLGQAGYFGVGGYAAGLLALHVTSNAFAQLGVAVGAAAAVALLTGVFAVRSRGVYFLMLTLAFGQLLFVLALNWTSLTGGSDGLYGIPAPTIAGKSSWLVPTDHFYWYTVGVFLVGYAALRIVVVSPFGRALAGIRGNEERMSSLGYNVALYKLAAFTFACAVAGYAGALACQQTKYFSPDEMSFEVSAVAVVVIVIGGQRTLVGAVLGSAFYYVVRDQLSGVLASHWQLALGAVFVLVVYLLPGGFVGRRQAASPEVRAMTAVLELTDVGRRYGELLAVDSVTLEVEAGSRHALIGPNGAGKSTLFGLISGTVRPTSGRVRFLGVDVSRRGPHRRTRLGMGRTFQHSSLFDDLAARENVAVAAQRTLGHARNAVLPTSRFRDVEARSEELLALVGLADLGDVDAGALSYGHRRQLEVALALATEPRLLLLDEPTAGMSREEAQQFMALIGGLPQELTLMIVEHDMDVVFELATVISVLDAGRLIATGPPEEIRTSIVVQEAYLGPGDRMEQVFTS